MLHLQSRLGKMKFLKCYSVGGANITIKTDFKFNVSRAMELDDNVVSFWCQNLDAGS